MASRWDSEEQRNLQRQVAYRSELWKKSTGAKTPWGSFQSSLNGYRNIRREECLMNEEAAIALQCATGLIKALEMRLERGLTLPQESINDLRLAWKILHRFRPMQEIPQQHIELFKKLADGSLLEQKDPPTQDSVADQNLAIASQTLRQVAKSFLSR